MSARRELNTYYGRAISDLAELAGRYAKITEQRVVGSTPIAYPAQPASSPWSTGIDQLTGKEPPLGYCIDEMEAEMSAEPPDKGASPSLASGAPGPALNETSAGPV